MGHNVYDLELHETVAVNDVILVTRVPGGWLYTVNLNHGENTMTFVPFNNEFQ